MHLHVGSLTKAGFRKLYLPDEKMRASSVQWINWVQLCSAHSLASCRGWSALILKSSQALPSLDARRTSHSSNLPLPPTPSRTPSAMSDKRWWCVCRRFVWDLCVPLLTFACQLFRPWLGRGTVLAQIWAAQRGLGSPTLLPSLLQLLTWNLPQCWSAACLKGWSGGMVLQRRRGKLL